MLADSDIYLSDERYIEALKRQQQRIKSGEALKTVDDNTMGHKETSATWGLCTDEWPEEDLTPKSRGAKYLQDGQICPFDGRVNKESHGCYYNCMIFQGGKDRPDRDKAIQLYQIRIDEVTRS